VNRCTQPGNGVCLQGDDAEQLGLGAGLERGA